MSHLTMGYVLTKYVRRLCHCVNIRECAHPNPNSHSTRRDNLFGVCTRIWTHGLVCALPLSHTPSLHDLIYRTTIAYWVCNWPKCRIWYIPMPLKCRWVHYVVSESQAPRMCLAQVLGPGNTATNDEGHLTFVILSWRTFLIRAMQ
jgi:hypothetical protein